MKKKVPRLKTDRQAEAFLAQDLSNLDFSQFRPARLNSRKRTTRLTCGSRGLCWRPWRRAQKRVVSLIRGLFGRLWSRQSPRRS